ncbi:GPI inositol-deacylase [Peziza echinospora]|nr:GPI inositol-deacylase [Peziza echinospora]
MRPRRLSSSSSTDAEEEEIDNNNTGLAAATSSSSSSSRQSASSAAGGLDGGEDDNRDGQLLIILPQKQHESGTIITTKATTTTITATAIAATEEEEEEEEEQQQEEGNSIAQPPSLSINNQKQKKQKKDEEEEKKKPKSESSPTTKASRKMEDPRGYRRPKARSVWRCSLSTLGMALLTAVVLGSVVYSFRTRQCDRKGCEMSHMRPGYAPLVNFDGEHTRFATKYKTSLYREWEFDQSSLEPKGVPVIFVPGNAGSYKQVRSIAKEAARQWAEKARWADAIEGTGMRKLDFFTVDFNEDITAFHGQTLLDQAEYLNDVVAYVLSLYHDARNPTPEAALPDPNSVIIVGHSMGGIVARTMLTMKNYQAGSVNTIVTLSTPHARAPVSFDEQIVSTYTHINDYWRKAHSVSPRNNPLANVTLISIAGGGLDTVVPSDYADVSSILPESHGFTVFSSTIPKVWVGIDHLAILWCRQLMTAVVEALIDVVDDRRPSQTKPLEERMTVFKKRFLTGMEENAEKTLPKSEPTTLLTLQDPPDSILPQGQRLVISRLGEPQNQRAYLIPIPPASTDTITTRFNLLTDQKLEQPDHADIEVLMCSILPLESGRPQPTFSSEIDFSDTGSGADDASSRKTRLACKSASADVILLPVWTPSQHNPTGYDVNPVSYLQYDLEDLVDGQYMVVIDKAPSPRDAFVVAEFVDAGAQTVRVETSLVGLLVGGARVVFPAAARPMAQEVVVPAIHSSLLAWKLTLVPVPSSTSSSSLKNCEARSLFNPILRQYLSDPYESKYFVDVLGRNGVDINLHGSAPFMPQNLKRRKGKAGKSGLALQFWIDPTMGVVCEGEGEEKHGVEMEVTLKLDAVGSLGKLVMRYRTIFAAFPVMVVALVLRVQFREYDTKGRFISFNDGLDRMMARFLPLLLVFFSIVSAYLAVSSSLSVGPFEEEDGVPSSSSSSSSSSTTTRADYVLNDLLIGLQDPFFWFLAPAFALVSVGSVVVVNYILLCILWVVMVVCDVVVGIGGVLGRVVGRRRVDGPSSSSSTETLLLPPTLTSTTPTSSPSSSPPPTKPSSHKRRIITTIILLLFVAFIVPFQFAYLIACVVQLSTCVKALKRTTGGGGSGGDNPTTINNFLNFTTTLLLLMLLLLPIHLPILVVWIRNLAVQWGTPFSSHHNIVSVLPFLWLVGILAEGRSGGTTATTRRTTINSNSNSTTLAMIPRVRGRAGRAICEALLLGTAGWAAVWGVSYAYGLHGAVDVLVGWWVGVYFWGGGGVGKGRWWERGGGGGEEDEGEAAEGEEMGMGMGMGLGLGVKERPE